MTDEDLIAIRDNHLPSQGALFDCIAFARAVLTAQGDPVLQGKLMHRLGALTSVADAVCKQFSLAGIAAKVGSINPAEDLHGRAQMALRDAALTDSQREYFLRTARALDDIGLLDSDREADALRAIAI